MAETDTELTPTQTPPPELAPKEDTSLTMSSDVLRVMMERALSYPRNLKHVRENAFAELEIVPELAARSYYSIPYNQGKQNESRVEGPSVKAAMTLARNWGNSYNSGFIVNEDKSNYYVNGVFFDLQTNSSTIKQIRVSKFYKPRGSQGVVPKNADMLYNSVQAGISKAVRNAVLAGLPDWLVSGYFNRAKEIVVNPPKSDVRPVDSIQDRILKGKQLICRTFKVTSEEMEAYITENADCYEDDGALLIHLQGLYNTLKDGQDTVNEVFRPNQKDKDMPGMPQEKK